MYFLDYMMEEYEMDGLSLDPKDDDWSLNPCFSKIVTLYYEYNWQVKKSVLSNDT